MRCSISRRRSNSSLRSHRPNSVEDRERFERDLLAHYLSRLTAYGVTTPDVEQAWHDYRESLTHGYFLWAITHRVQPDIVVEFVTRLGTAAAAHDSFGLLGV